MGWNEAKMMDPDPSILGEALVIVVKGEQEQSTYNSKRYVAPSTLICAECSKIDLSSQNRLQPRPLAVQLA